MRVFILSNDDLTSNVIFSPLLRDPAIDVVGVGFTSTVTAKKGGIAGAFAVLKQCDWRYWSYLVVTNGMFAVFDRLARWRRSPEGWLRSLRAECRRGGVPVHGSANFNSPEFVETLRAMRPDLVVIRVDQILKRPLLEVPRLGTWCVHSSLLPAYKGIAGEFHALRCGESTIGTTIFEVTERLDAGRSLLQCPFAVREEHSVFRHMLRNNRLAAEMLVEAVRDLAQDDRIVEDVLDPPPEACYFSWPSPADVAEFRKRGGRLLHLRDLWNFLRLMSTRNRTTTWPHPREASECPRTVSTGPPTD